MELQSDRKVKARAEFASVALIPVSDWSRVVTVKIECLRRLLSMPGTGWLLRDTPRQGYFSSG
jgi:hypothetical protein